LQQVQEILVGDFIARKKENKIIQFSRIRGVKSKILTKQSSPTVTICV
jgi:hypothetical protein